MDSYYIRSDLLVVSALLPVAVGAYRFSRIDSASKVFLYRAALGLLTESLAYYMAVRYHNNLPVYNVSSIMGQLLVCIYFNYTVDWFRRKNIGIIIGLVSVLLGLVNDFYIQSVYGITRFFLLYQLVTIIVMSMLSLSTFFKPDDTRQIKNDVHFWFPVILIFSWCFTGLFFSLLDFYATAQKMVPNGVVMALFLTEVLSNVAVAVVFSMYPNESYV